MDFQNKIHLIIPFKDTLNESLMGIEKEGLRVSMDGAIAQTPHPIGLGSALKNPAITTDFSEALLELVTQPLVGAEKVLDELGLIHDFTYRHMPEDERFWPASMPCVLRGKTNIPIASYGSSNIGMMKTVYRRGFSNRYGSVMQAIAGIHFNFSFSENFFESYKKLVLPSETDLKGFKDSQYMGLTRNVLRYGWLIPYLFGSSASVCKSFMQDYHEHDLEEFDENTLYLPYATSLRMGDIGYQNSQEDEKGVKASYNSLRHYVYALRAAMHTNCRDFEKIGLKKNGEYQQLNTNILQIANEYYSSVRPKPILNGSNRPLKSVSDDGIGYIEIRSLDVNPLLEIGIDKEQVEFLEAFLLFCLLEDSPIISTAELVEIDSNALLVAHQGRRPGLKMGSFGQKIDLAEWGENIFKRIKQCAKLLSGPHQNSVENISARIQNPDLTPSAIILNQMQSQEKGFFEFTNQYSLDYKAKSLKKIFDKDHFNELNNLAIKSKKEQLEIESSQTLNFDEYLKNYFLDDF